MNEIQLSHRYIILGSKVHDAMLGIAKYRVAALEQHARAFAKYKEQGFVGALIELHFFFIAMNRIHALLQLASGDLQGEVREFVSGLNYQDYCDARDHFEHREKRLYSLRPRDKRNAPIPTTEGGANPRTVSFGITMQGDRHVFKFSDPNGLRFVDISVEAITKFESELDRFTELVDAELAKKEEGWADQCPAS